MVDFGSFNELQSHFRTPFVPLCPKINIFILEILFIYVIFFK